MQKWLEAWDVEGNRSRDNAKLQVFYNNVLGEAFEVRGLVKVARSVDELRTALAEVRDRPRKLATTDPRELIDFLNERLAAAVR